MNSHLTQLLGLVVIAAWAILSAKGIKGRLLSLLTILAFMAVGLGTGFAVGARDENLAFAQQRGDQLDDPPRRG